MIYQADFDKFRVTVEIKNDLIRRCQVSYIENSAGENRSQFPDIPDLLKKEIESYFRGKDIYFDSVNLDFSTITEFQKDVYSALRKIPFGKTITYKELAVLSGHHKAQRAVGRALSLNPFLLFVP